MSSFPSFEPTYKELKHTFFFDFFSSLFGFEPTYKELKQYHCILFSIVSNSVLSLPIRNWNLSCKIKLRKSCFTSFEPTYKELKLGIGVDSHFPVEVLSLPIRNWNKLPRFFSLGQNIFSSFEPTYKELKPTTLPLLYPPHQLFWAYL